MKLLSSSSSSSSASSSTTSFDVNVCNSKRATAGCIVGVIRRFLCSTSLPTYPSDHITENNSVLCENDHQSFKDKQTPPGLMARLMGLETMPATNSAHSQLTPNSITRSRSMNSADYLQQCDEMQGGKHRRVKTSLSFRELPTFLELENEEFFVLSFENASKTKELGSSKGKKKTEMGCGELKQKRAERRKNKENRTENVPEKRKDEDQETRKKVSIEKENLITRVVVSDNSCQLVGDNFNVKEESTNILRPTTKNSTAEPPCTPSSDVVKPLKPKEACDAAAKLRKKIKNHSVDKKVVLESCSEDWSPVSVFEFEEFLFDLQVPISDEDSRRKDSNSRRKLSPELDKYRHPSPQHNSSETSSIVDDRESPPAAIDLGSRKKDAQKNINCVSSSMWCEICRLARGDIMGSNWRRCRRGGDMGKNLEEFEEISAGFDIQILDQLLNELVDQLVEPLMQKH